MPKLICIQAWLFQNQQHPSLQVQSHQVTDVSNLIVSNFYYGYWSRKNQWNQVIISSYKANEQGKGPYQSFSELSKNKSGFSVCNNELVYE